MSLVLLTLFLPLLSALLLVLLAAVSFSSVAITRRILEHTHHGSKHIPAVRHASSWISTLFLGDFQAIKNAPPGEKHVQWMHELGPVFRYRHMLFVERILLADPRAMMHILNHSAKYPKPEHTTTFLSAVLGNGLVTTEGDAHRRQKKIITPAFSPAAVRELQGVMNKHAVRLTDKISESISLMASGSKATGQAPLQPGQAQPDREVPLPMDAPGKGPTAIVDVLFWLSRTTLDIIGETGFNHNFDSLGAGSQSSPLVAAVHDLVSSVMDVDLVQAISILLSEKPGMGWLRRLPTRRNKATWKSQTILKEEARRIVARAKADITAETHLLSKGRSETSMGLCSDLLEQASTSTNTTNRALMWRLIRANLAADLKESERLSDDELLDQMTTFLFAGHETTATQTSWALYLLAESKSVQDKLRQEVSAFHEDTLDPDAFEGLENLSYLDAVAREVVRLMPSVVSTVRVVKEDDVVPLSRSYASADGQSSFDSVVLPKGHELFIPLATLQRNPEIWGADADEFKPERWMALPSSVQGAKLPGHTLAFLAGARSCPGQRLAMQELKVLLARLISSFEFRRVPQYELVQRQMIVRRALVKGQEEHGTRLPLFVTKLQA